MNIFKNKYGEIRSGWDMLWVSILILFVLQLIFSIIITPLGSDPPTFIFSISTQLIWECISIIVLLLIWKFYHKESLKNLGLTKKNRWKDLTLGLLIGALSISSVFGILLYANQISINHINFSIVLTPQYLLYIILYISIGFWEEMLSRGYFMSMLKRTRNIYAIILIPSVIFSFLHALNPNVVLLGLLNIFIVGILFSLMFYKRGSLWMPIGFHITWNFFQGNVFGLNVSGINNYGYSIIQTDNLIFANKLLTGAEFGPEGGIVTTVIIIILIIVFLVINKKEDKSLWNIYINK